MTRKIKERNEHSPHRPCSGAWSPSRRSPHSPRADPGGGLRHRRGAGGQPAYALAGAVGRAPGHGARRVRGAGGCDLRARCDRRRVIGGDRAADGSCLRLNSFVGAREREQALYGFKDMCDVIVYSHEVGWLKPDPPSTASRASGWAAPRTRLCSSTMSPTLKRCCADRAQAVMTSGAPGVTTIVCSSLRADSV
jgi:hypothetical protein